MIKLRGGLELHNKLDKLSFAVEERITDKALKQASTPIIKEARRRIKFDFGDGFFERDGKLFNIEDIKQSMTKVIRRKGKSKFSVIGPASKKGWWAHWLEFGTLAHRKKPLEQGRKKQAKILAARTGKQGMGLVKVPFMRPAFFSKSTVALKKMQFVIEKELKKV